MRRVGKEKHLGQSNSSAKIQRSKDRHNLAYVYNMNSNPSYDKYFAKRLDTNGNPIAINNDLFALGCLIQWIWRSAIRENEEIWIFIPAPRMRNLLIEWMDGEI